MVVVPRYQDYEGVKFTGVCIHVVLACYLHLHDQVECLAVYRNSLSHGLVTCMHACLLACLPEFVCFSRYCI